MANKSYKYRILWSWRDEGNKVVEDMVEVSATSVPRAISKLINKLNWNSEEEGVTIKASDLMILDVRCSSFDDSHKMFQHDRD